MGIGFERNVPASEHKSSWHSRTLQPCGGGTYVHTIETHVQVPHTVDAQRQEAVIDNIEAALLRDEVDYPVIVGLQGRPG